MPLAGERVVIGIRETAIGANPDGNEPNIFSNFDNTQFHDYRLEGTPGVGWAFFADNAMIGSGTFVPSTTPTSNGIGFGDGTQVGRARAEITSFTFSQDVPEPSTSALLIITLTGVGVSRRKPIAS